ncbi:hypothetical protein THAOC_23123, partial [Thalassiosira oceanica]
EEAHRDGRAVDDTGRARPGHGVSQARVQLPRREGQRLLPVHLVHHLRRDGPVRPRLRGDSRRGRQEHDGHAFEPLRSAEHQPAAPRSTTPTTRTRPRAASPASCTKRRTTERLVSTLSTAGAVPDVSSEDALSLVSERASERLDGGSQAASYRLTSLMESNVIFGKALDAVKEYRATHRHNSGWQGKGRVVVTADEGKAHDLEVAEIIRNHRQVWVVTEKGAAPPSEGTLITSDRNAAGEYFWKDCQSEDEATEFRYSHDDFYSRNKDQAAEEERDSVNRLPTEYESEYLKPSYCS